MRPPSPCCRPVDRVDGFFMTSIRTWPPLSVRRHEVAAAVPLLEEGVEIGTVAGAQIEDAVQVDARLLAISPLKRRSGGRPGGTARRILEEGDGALGVRTTLPLAISSRLLAVDGFQRDACRGLDVPLVDGR